MAKIILTILILFFMISCNHSDNQQQRELGLKEKGLMSKEKELSATTKELDRGQIPITAAVKIAQDQFRNYLPKILDSHNAILDLQKSYTGDFTGDGIEDVAIYFSLARKEGGNALAGQGLSLYQNNGKSVKVVAGFEPDYLFSFDKISGGNIYVNKLEYAENDGRCCPSIKIKHRLTINGNKAY